MMWHFLSLDAPTVAAVWVWFIAKACRMRLPVAVPAAMAIMVWMLYVADRLLDAQRTGAGVDLELEARHLFHHQHRGLFLVATALAGVGLAALLPSLDPAAMRLYLMEGALLLAWFVILHATRGARRLPKEIAVGLFFSAAMFIPSVAREPDLRRPLLLAAILLAAVCSLNCVFIYAWEHEGAGHSTGRMAHTTTRFAVAHLAAVAISIAAGGCALALFGATMARPIAAACALAAVILFALHCNRRRLSRNDLRASADMALLTPLLLLPFLR